MTSVFLSLGSNLRSPERQIRLAIARLQQMPEIYITKIAPLFKNPAVGLKAQPDFCNTVIAIKTRLPPEALLKKCQFIENKHGRIRHIKWGARTLDIDILLFGLLNCKTVNLTIPHPHLLKRKFVLFPLLQIAPDIKWPDGRKIKDIL